METKKYIVLILTIAFLFVIGHDVIPHHCHHTIIPAEHHEHSDDYGDCDETETECCKHSHCFVFNFNKIETPIITIDQKVSKNKLFESFLCSSSIFDQKDLISLNLLFRSDSDYVYKSDFLKSVSLRAPPLKS